MSQRRQFESFGAKINKFGFNFAVCNNADEVVLLCEGGKYKSNPEQLSKLSRQALCRLSEKSGSDETDMPVWRFGDTNIVLAVVLKSARLSNKDGEVSGTALIDLGDKSLCPASVPPNDTNCVNPVQMDSNYLAEMLELLVEKFQAETKAEKQIEMVGTELSQTYEELVLLHKLSTNMKVTESDANFLQMACDSLTEIVCVEGIAILLEKTIDDKQQLVVAAGSGLIDIDEQTAAILHSGLMDEINSGKEALLDSEVDSAFKYEWPDNINNIIAVPLCGKEKTESGITGKNENSNCMMGLMVAINRIGKQDFDSTDIKLFNSVAGGCAVFIENGELFKDLKELFIGSLKALTSSIDAKDKYTHGHSERVAFISRWIAEKLSEREQLDEEQIHMVYLAGLLHDIGKIGIEEVVLRKKGKLTEQEFNRIKQHPSIGAGILHEIKQMRDIIPGVLSHHERVDGRGYPDGLVGEQIPLTGRIVGLADSFDAMTSKRTYRDAMTVEHALEEIGKGLGTQFDEKLGRIFLDSDVGLLWDIIQNGFNNIYQNGDSVEYGAAAVGTLIG
ncbi:MAG: HD domain-containing protein [Planctomycetes bacterium]|nr:HD domain-containing protein [Planctomycetota bacterium]MBL7142645.1 HD domain-containing protein [Phycisphaerae bacterium]